MIYKTMQKLKHYSEFIIKEGIIDDLLRTSKENAKSKILNFNTEELLSAISDKIKTADSSTVYIFSKNMQDHRTYILGELSENINKFSLTVDRGKIKAGNNIYSTAILDASSFKGDVTGFTDTLYKIMSNNQRNGCKNAIEIENFSLLNDEIKKVIINSIKNKKIEQYLIQDGDFFILGDIEGVSGTKNSSEEISGLLGSENFYNILHNFTQSETRTDE